MRADIVPGAVLPDYELPDHTGRHRRLSELQGDDPMVLVLARGAFCPKERWQHRSLVEFAHLIDVGYARLVTLTSDDSLMEVAEFRAGVGASWPFLYDARRVVATDLEILEYTDEAHRPQIPHTFVLAPGLVIERIYCGYWFWGRPTTDELHRDLRAVSERIRPDWRIDSPEMRARWDAGDREAFWPYGKSMVEVLRGG